MRQITKDNLLKNPLKTTIFKYEQRDYFWSVNSGTIKP